MWIGIGLLALVLWVVAFGIAGVGSGGFYALLAAGLVAMIIAIFTRSRIARPDARN